MKATQRGTSTAVPFVVVIVTLLGAPSVAHAQGYEAEFVSWSVPATLLPGDTGAVSITMRNSGTEQWEDCFLWVPAWGVAGTNIWRLAPGREHTFRFNIQGPMLPGSYGLDAVMFSNQWGEFGEPTPTAWISVPTFPPVAPNPNYGIVVGNITQPEIRARASELGAGWLRMEDLWKDIQPSSTTWVWSSVDANLDYARDNGYHVLFTLMGTPAWAESPGCAAPGSGKCPPNLSYWYTFCHEIMARY
jgi:hypothetical protein